MPEGRFTALTERELKIARSLREKKYRELHGAFLIEGVRLCEEAIDAEQPILYVIVTPAAASNERVNRLLNICGQRDIPISSIAETKYRSLSDEQSPAGIAMTVAKRASAHLGLSPLILAIDALQDPGNLGTILRSANWFGISEVLLGRGCVDLYNPKVVRAGMGSLFRLNIIENAALFERLMEMSRQGYRLIAASSSASINLFDVTPGPRDLLLIGSEAQGISPELLHHTDVVVKIPKLGGGESLNAAVAASVCLYHLTHSGKSAVDT